MLCQYGQFYNILFYQLTMCLFLIKYLFVSFVYLNFSYMYQLRLWWCFFCIFMCRIWQCLFLQNLHVLFHFVSFFVCLVVFFHNTSHAPFDNGFLYNIYKNHLTMWCFLFCLFYNIYMCHFHVSLYCLYHLIKIVSVCNIYCIIYLNYVMYLIIGHCGWSFNLTILIYQAY